MAEAVKVEVICLQKCTDTEKQKASTIFNRTTMYFILFSYGYQIYVLIYRIHITVFNIKEFHLQLCRIVLLNC